MSMPPPATEQLARRLMALECTRVSSLPPFSGGAQKVCGRFQISLARLGGVVGFRSLLTRAVALGKKNHPGLEGVQVLENGTLAGLGDGLVDWAGETAIVSHLIDLLNTLIGEHLTLQLVRDSWPEVVAEGTDGGVEEQP